MDTDITLPHSVKFAEKWVEWIQFRKDIKKPYKTNAGITKSLNMLKVVSESEACQMIDYSIANEYQGIFPVKKKFDKAETSLTVSWLKPKPVSQEPAKYFNPEDGKSFIIGRIKKAYEAGVHLNDAGSVYTNRLKPFLSTPDNVLAGIVEEVTLLINEKPGNRFEEKKEYNYNLEVRNRILKYNFDQWRSQENKIWEKL